MVGRTEVSFSCEDPVVQANFEGVLPERVAEVVIADVLAILMAVTGQEGRLTRIA